MTYALERPSRVGRVTLLDPTMCFAPLYPHYIARALPALMKPTSARRASLIRWESKRGTPCSTQNGCRLTSMGAEVFGDAPTVPTKIPKPATLKDLRPPALIIVAGSTRVHHPRRVARRAGQHLAD